MKNYFSVILNITCQIWSFNKLYKVRDRIVGIKKIITTTKDKKEKVQHKNKNFKNETKIHKKTIGDKHQIKQLNLQWSRVP